MSAKFYLSVVISLFLMAPLAQGQTVSSLQYQINKAQTDIKTLTQQQQSLQSQLESTERELAVATNRPSPEKDAYNDAKAYLDEVTAAHNAAPSDDSQAKVANAEFKLALAERKMKKANSAASELSDKRDALAEALSANQTNIAKLEQQLSRQSEELVELRKKNELAAQRAEVERLKAALEASEREKAALMEKQRAEAAAEAAALAAAQEKAKAEAAAKAAQVRQAPVAATSKPAATPVKPAASLPEAPAASPVADNNGITLLGTRQQVAAFEAKLAQQLSTEDPDKAKFSRMLNIKPANEASKVEVRSQKLEPLGHEQYQGKGKLQSGDTTFALGFFRWDQAIPAAANNAEFTFILDASDSKNPRLYYYLSSLSSNN